MRSKKIKIIYSLLITSIGYSSNVFAACTSGSDGYNCTGDFNSSNNYGISYSTDNIILNDATVNMTGNSVELGVFLSSVTGGTVDNPITSKVTLNNSAINMTKRAGTAADVNGVLIAGPQANSKLLAEVIGNTSFNIIASENGSAIKVAANSGFSNVVAQVDIQSPDFVANLFLGNGGYGLFAAASPSEANKAIINGKGNITITDLNGNKGNVGKRVIGILASAYDTATTYDDKNGSIIIGQGSFSTNIISNELSAGFVTQGYGGNSVTNVDINKIDLSGSINSVGILGFKNDDSNGSQLLINFNSGKILSDFNNSKGIIALIDSSNNFNNDINVFIGRDAEVNGGAGDGLKDWAVMTPRENTSMGIYITGGLNQYLNNYGIISSANDFALYSYNASKTGITTIKNYGVINGVFAMDGQNNQFTNMPGATWNIREGSEATTTIDFNMGVANINMGYGYNDVKGALRNEGTINIGDQLNNVIFDHVNFTNTGLVNIANKAPGFIPTDLVVKGNYIGNGGFFKLNVALTGDTGYGDKLVVDGGKASGSTKLGFNIVANNGSITRGDGIKVVDAINGATTSTGSFSLLSPLYSGASEYQLVRGDNSGNGNSWYLRTGEKLVNPAVGSFLSNQTMSTQMFMHKYRDRVASRVSSGNEQADSPFWMRTLTYHTKSAQAGNALKARSDTTVVHLGLDLVQWDVKTGLLQAGIMGGYGHNETTNTSKATAHKMKGRNDGYMVGAYGTFTEDQDKGVYVDTWTQYAWFKNKVTGSGLTQTNKYDSHVWSTSAEVGYGFDIGTTQKHRWGIEPNMQIVYVQYDADHKTRNNLRVTDDNADGVNTRLGMRFYGKGLTNANSVQPFLETNWKYSDAKNSLKVNGRKFSDGQPHSRGEIKLGATGNIGKAVLWGSIGSEFGDNSFNRFEGQLGVSYSW